MLDSTRTLTLHCPSAEELSAFFDGRLPPPRCDAVADHVEACDTCVDKLSTLSVDSDALIEELRSPPEPEPIGRDEAERDSAIAGSVSAPDGRSRATTAPTTMTGPRPGRQLGPYELVALIGEGGMGQVWRARHTVLGRDVAVKLIHPGRI